MPTGKTNDLGGFMKSLFIFLACIFSVNSFANPHTALTPCELSAPHINGDQIMKGIQPSDRQESNVSNGPVKSVQGQ